MTSRRAVRLVSVGVYGPTAVAEVGIGAMLPVFALSALSMGSSALVASLAVGAYTAGRIAGSLLGGVMTARRGGARAAWTSLMLMALTSVVCAAAVNVWMFAGGALGVGVAHAWYHVARQGQINSLIPHHIRARSLTSLAGIWRIGNFVGPLLGTVVIAWWGLPWTYVMAAGTMLAGATLLRLSSAWRHDKQVPVRSGLPLRTVVKQSRAVLTRVGAMVVLMGALRQGRLVVIPLWGAHVGLSDETTSLIFAAAAGVDMVLFYPAGLVMDRWGQLWTLIPSTGLLALGTAAMPLAQSAGWVLAVSLVLGLGNGWGSGSIMVLGATLAPPGGRDTFTGVWMVLQDTGGLLGPLVVSAGAAASLAAGMYALGGVGGAAVWGMNRWVPRYAHRPLVTPAAPPQLRPPSA